jgi:phospholipase D1/2
MVIEDEKVRIVNMEGKDFPAAEFAHTLRLEIFKEHFGLSEPELIDPLSEEMHNLINLHAKVSYILEFYLFFNLLPIIKRNTEIYREVFACYPDDNVTRMSQFDDFVRSAQPERYTELKDEIFGHAVELPLDFLKDERLTFKIQQKEYFVPEHNFT